MSEVSVGGMASDATGTRTFATTYGSWIYISQIPANRQ